MKKQDRRKFLQSVLKLSGLGIGISVGGLFISSCEQNESPVTPGDTKESYNLNSYPVLLQVGGSILISTKAISYPLIIKRLSDDEFLALNSKCKHQGCPVGLPKEDNPNIVCPCHGSEYSSLDGSVAKKPNDGSDITALDRYAYQYDALTMILTIDFGKIIN